MSQAAIILAAAFIGYPIWMYLKHKTGENLDRVVVPAKRSRTRKVKGPKPPDDKLPPLVGNIAERTIARKLLP